ncbi:hypothetical protein HKD37_14G040452 [Glycine soja]
MARKVEKLRAELASADGRHWGVGMAVMEESSSTLSRTQRHATASLFALALHHSQIHQTRISGIASRLLKYKAKRMVVSFQFLTLLSEEGDATTPEGLDKETALTKAIDASALSMNNTTPISDSPSWGHGQKTRSQDDVCEIMESLALLPGSNGVCGCFFCNEFSE